MNLLHKAHPSLLRTSQCFKMCIPYTCAQNLNKHVLILFTNMLHSQTFPTHDFFSNIPTAQHIANGRY